jgi:hypothetical protein
MKVTGSRIEKLDRVDRQMVSLLQKDGRMPIVSHRQGTGYFRNHRQKPLETPAR